MGQNSILDLFLALLTPLAPSLVMILYRNRKYILKLLQTVSDFAKRGADEQSAVDEQAAQDAYLAYMAYAGAIDKRVDLLGQMQARSDAGIQRVEGMINNMKVELLDSIQETGKHLRVRLDSQLLNDSRLHREQNARLDGHDDDIISLKRRMDIADEYLKTLRSDLDDCLKKGA